MHVANGKDMDDDARYFYACRLGLLAGAMVHWVGAAMLVSSHFSSESTWQYSRPIRRLAVALLQTFITG
jgi:hypothetical protein